MANWEHLAILRQDIDAWNHWKKQHSEVEVDLSGIRLYATNLSGANLSGANLSGANFSWAWTNGSEDDTYDASDLSNANLSGANLRGADLHEVNLSGANLYRADLHGANLHKADLHRANLRGANLRGQDLSNKDLSKANFSGADLSSADLSKAWFSGADLSGADLSGADLSKAWLSGAGRSLLRANPRRDLMDNRYLNRADPSRADISRAWLKADEDEVYLAANLSRANLNGANLSETNLSRVDFSEANLSGADLSEAWFHGVNLHGANLSGANLSGQDLSNKDLSKANLSGANLSGANLSGQDLSNKDLSKANLSDANLSRTLLIGTNFTEAILTDCIIYGISAWNVRLENAIQKNLIITQEGEATITVDNLKIAQLIYLLLNNVEIRDVIDTIARKVVLILGRFSTERKVVLDAIRDTLQKQNYSPVIFDFEKPGSRNFTETMRTLAHLSRFIIADLTNPSSIPQELYAIIPTLAVPVQPLLEAPNKEYSMFIDLSSTYHWVLPIHRYTDLTGLLSSLKENVIEPAEKKAQELEKR